MSRTLKNAEQTVTESAGEQKQRSFWERYVSGDIADKMASGVDKVIGGKAVGEFIAKQLVKANVGGIGDIGKVRNPEMYAGIVGESTLDAAKPVAGDLLTLGSIIAPSSVIAAPLRGAVGAGGKALRLGTQGQNVLRTATTEGLRGYGADIGVSLSEGEEGADIFMPSYGAATGAGLTPAGVLISRGARGARTLATRGAEVATGVPEGTIAYATKDPKTAKAIEDLVSGASTRTTVEVLDDTRGVLTKLETNTKQQYKSVFDGALAANAAKGEKVARETLEQSLITDDKLGKFGVKLDDNGQLDFSAVLVDEAEARALKKALYTSKEVKPVFGAGEYGLAELDLARKRVGNLWNKNRSGQFNAISTIIRGELRDQIHKLAPDQIDNLQYWGDRQEIIEEMNRALTGRNAESTLNNLYGKNKTELRRMFAAFESETNAEILDELMKLKVAQNLTPVFATTGSRTQDILRSIIITGGGTATGGIGGGVFAALATSPRVVGKISTRLAQMEPQLAAMSAEEAAELVRRALTVAAAEAGAEEQQELFEQQGSSLPAPDGATANTTPNVLLRYQ